MSIGCVYPHILWQNYFLYESTQKGNWIFHLFETFKWIGFLPQAWPLMIYDRWFSNAIAGLLMMNADVYNVESIVIYHLRRAVSFWWSDISRGSHSRREPLDRMVNWMDNWDIMNKNTTVIFYYWMLGNSNTDLFQTVEESEGEEKNIFISIQHIEIRCLERANIQKSKFLKRLVSTIYSTNHWIQTIK